MSVFYLNINITLLYVSGNILLYHCSALTAVTIPTSITSLGEGVFAGTSLTSVVVPSSISVISPYTFQDCNSLTNVTIRQGVTTIASNAFLNCAGLRNVTIPDSVTTINAGTISSNNIGLFGVSFLLIVISLILTNETRRLQELSIAELY